MLCNDMKQDAFIELIKSSNTISIEVIETHPTKGKPLDKSSNVWIVSVILPCGSKLALTSSRGGVREWASLDRLNSWLREYGINEYSIHSKGLVV